MADPRFFTKAGPFTAAELARVAGVDLREAADAERSFGDVAPLDTAGPDQISFFENKKYLAAFMASRAGACLVHPDMADKAPSGMVLLISKDPYRAYAKVAAAYYPVPVPVPAIAATSVIDPSARIADSARIEAGAVIQAQAEIGPRCLIAANAVIGSGVTIGADTVIGAGATLSHAIIGERVFVHPGVRIGQDGFGFSMGPAGHLKVPQLGRVVIHDDVEIGANSTIDRGAGPDTVIGAGCKIDNLVQIGHNVQLGRGCIMVAQSGIAGSTTLGDFVVVAGQVGIIGHLHIGSGAKIGAQSGVTRDVAAGETMGGSPAVTMTQWLRQTAELSRLVRKKGR